MCIAILLCDKIRTATRSCRTRKRSFHFYSLGVVRRRRNHAAALYVREYSIAVAATGAAVYRQFDGMTKN